MFSTIFKVFLSVYVCFVHVSLTKHSKVKDHFTVINLHICLNYYGAPVKVIGQHSGTQTIQILTVRCLQTLTYVTVAVPPCCCFYVASELLMQLLRWQAHMTRSNCRCQHTGQRQKGALEVAAAGSCSLMLNLDNSNRFNPRGLFNPNYVIVISLAKYDINSGRKGPPLSVDKEGFFVCLFFAKR